MIAVGANDHIVRVFDRRKIQGRLFEVIALRLILHFYYIPLSR